MKRRTLLFVTMFLTVVVFAQNLSFKQYQQQQEYSRSFYKSQQQQEYDAYRLKVNSDYANFISKKWKEYGVHAAVPAPASKDPIKPIVQASANVENIKQALKVRMEITITDPQQPEPIVRLFEFEIPEGSNITFVPSDRDNSSEEEKGSKVPQPEPQYTQPSFPVVFYGTTCEVHWKNDMKFILNDIYEEAIAQQWHTLATDARFDTLINDCLEIRQRLKLCDWGYINFIQELSNKTLGASSNEAVVLQMYLLTQSGYKARVARTIENSLVLLVPFDEDIYTYRYIYSDACKYYILDKDKGQSSMYMFTEPFPREQVSSIKMKSLPKFSFEKASPRKLQARGYSQCQVMTNQNLNIISFLNSYPLSSHWELYSMASLSPELKASIFPTLKEQISGLSQTQAANLLINFVQTAFDYQTDQQQFGYERPLFGDEVCYYPYSDCEDRSILYSLLVRELLGLDVVLIEYPGHLATAVHFTQGDPVGYYYKVDGVPYTLCDPTYINAPIGSCMPDYLSTPVTVIKFPK